jgi:hypothetical protein
MVVISKSVLNQFIEKYPKSAEAVLRWYLLCKESDWSAFEDIKKVFPATDAVGNDLYVFNVDMFLMLVEISSGLLSGLFSKQERFSFASLELMVNMTRSSFPTYNASPKVRGD